MKAHLIYFTFMVLMMTGTARLVLQYTWPKAALYGLLVGGCSVGCMYLFNKWTAKRVRKTK